MFCVTVEKFLSNISLERFALIPPQDLSLFQMQLFSFFHTFSSMTLKVVRPHCIEFQLALLVEQLFTCKLSRGYTACMIDC